MIVYIVGQYKENANWEFQGVFSTEEKAIEACVNDSYFIGPATLDRTLPEETCEWKNAYLPIREINNV